MQGEEKQSPPPNRMLPDTLQGVHGHIYLKTPWKTNSSHFIGEATGCRPRPHTWSVEQSRAASVYSPTPLCSAPHPMLPEQASPPQVTKTAGIPVWRTVFETFTIYSRSWILQKRKQILYLSVIYSIFFRKVWYFNQSLCFAPDSLTIPKMSKTCSITK